MRLLEIVQSSAGMRMEDQDGVVEQLRLSSALSAAEMRDLERSLPCPLPEDVRELLSFTRGFENGPLESVDFAGLSGGFGLDEVFPNPLAIAHDGYGNYWIVDLHRDSTDWGPIFYACHDPPVIVLQTRSFEHFLTEVLRFANTPHASEIDDIHETAASRIWRENPGAVPAPQLRQAADPVLRSFAGSLSDAFLIVDLRTAAPGDGFSWGRYGPKSKVVRYENQLLFAYESKTKWQRFLGR